MKITGELLKAERVNQGLTVQGVSQSLKLSSKIITAIEAGDTSQLPAKTFVRGFVKSYAEFLKLDPDLVLRQFQEEMGSTTPLPKVPPPMPSTNGENIRATKPALRHTSQNYSQNNSATTTSIKQQNLEEQNMNNRILMFLMGAVVLVILIVAGNKFFGPDNSLPVAANTTEVDSTNVIIPSFESVDPTAASTSDTTTALATPASGPTTVAS